MKNSMRPLFCVVLVLAVFSCYSTPTYAWGEVGHRIVANSADPLVLEP